MRKIYSDQDVVNINLKGGSPQGCREMACGFVGMKFSVNRIPNHLKTIRPFCVRECTMNLNSTA
jgi:hypothetical protein